MAFKNSSGKEETWHLDLKEQGIVDRGTAPSGQKPDGQYTILASDSILEVHLNI